MADYRASGLRRPNDLASAKVFLRGQGPWLWDTEGHAFLDCVSGYSSTNFGHAHPRITRVCQEQSETLSQLVGWPNESRLKLEQMLAELSPWGTGCRVWLSTSGARAVEVAWKIAYARRPGLMVAFKPAFHGRSIATAPLSMTTQLPVMPTPFRPELPYPECARCPVSKTPDSCHAECIEPSVKALGKTTSPISAIIVEPGLGARGYEFPPKVFFKRLRQVADQSGCLLIFDEIQMGLGRMGTIFASQAVGVTPDLIVLGKSLGGGLVPISSVIGPSDTMDSLEPGIESETFGGNPLGCRIAAEVLMLLRDQGFLNRAKQIGERLRSGLQESVSLLHVPNWIEGIGPNAAVEFYPSNPNQGESIARLLVKSSLEVGLLVHHSGRFNNRIAFIPPINIGNMDLEMVLSRFREAVCIANKEQSES